MPPIRSESMARSKAAVLEQLSGGWLHAAQHYFGAVVAAYVLVLVVAGGWLMLRPAWQERTERLAAQTESATVQAKKVSDYDRRITELNAFLTGYEDIAPDAREVLFRTVPPEKNAEELFADLHAIVSQNGLLIGTISIESDTADEQPVARTARTGSLNKEEGKRPLPAGVAAVEVSLSVGALSYDSFKSLLRSLERHARLLDVQEVKFSPEAGEAEFTIRAYYAAPAPAAPAPAANGLVPDAVMPLP